MLLAVGSRIAVVDFYPGQRCTRVARRQRLYVSSLSCGSARMFAGGGSELTDQAACRPSKPEGAATPCSRKQLSV
jgi:hypothetical protein